MQRNTLFSNIKNEATEVNQAGGKAYKNSSELELARLVCTSFFGTTFYNDDSSKPAGAAQLERLIRLSGECSPEFVAAASVYARKVNYMKDAPVALLLTLRSRNKDLYKKSFKHVINDGRVLRGLVNMIRSGKFGSRSLGSCTRKLINNYLNSQSLNNVWNMSIGNNPSLRDVMRLSRPSPKGDAHREALYKLIVKNERTEDLPVPIKNYYAFLEDQNKEMPNVGFQRLTNTELTKDNWTKLGLSLTWNQLRMNANTLERHGVLDNKTVLSQLTAKLSNKEQVERARVFPYQIYTSILNVTNNSMKNALQDALDHSVSSVPELTENVVVAVDVSGSMRAAVNGNNINGGLTCSQVAALLAAAIYKKNPNTRVLTFATNTIEYTSQMNARDSMWTNIERIKFTGGNTDCSSPIKYVVANDIKCDLLIILSDNQSWLDYQPGRGATGMQLAWTALKKKNPTARLVNVDMTPSSTTQVPETSSDTLFMAGFTDNMFPLMDKWLKDRDHTFVKDVMDTFNSLT